MPEVRQFIRNNFGSPPKTPILDIPESQLLAANDHIVIVRDITRQIAGCIRYHYVGTIEEDIHLVDCFCIHPDWRGKGIGNYLLHDLHHRMIDKPYAIFLKEGSLLPVIPFYSSMYV